MAPMATMVPMAPMVIVIAICNSPNRHLRQSSISATLRHCRHCHHWCHWCHRHHTNGSPSSPFVPIGTIVAIGAIGAIVANESPSPWMLHWSNDPLTLKCELRFEWIKWRHSNGANGDGNRHCRQLSPANGDCDHHWRYSPNRHWRQWSVHWHHSLSPLAAMVPNDPLTKLTDPFTE